MTEHVHGVSCPLAEATGCATLLQPYQGSLRRGVKAHLLTVHQLTDPTADHIMGERYGHA